MSGSGTFAGTSFQAQVIAYVYVHMLGQRRLRWIPATDDTPSAVDGETEGPGDDAAIRFGQRLAPIEVQAKHGLKGGETLNAEIQKIAARAGTAQTKIVLAVDSGVTKAVRENLAIDLERMRSGRFDGLGPEAKQLRSSCTQTFLNLLHVITLDVAHDTTKLLLRDLEEMLEDSALAQVTLDVLAVDAHKLCAERRSHTRESLVQLLAAKNIKLRPPQAEEHRTLDVSRDMLNSRQTKEGLALLDHLERGLSAAGTKPDPSLLYRIHCQRANAALQSDDAPTALLLAQRAIDLDPERFEGLLTASNAAAAASDFATSKRYVERALKVRPHDPRAWGLAAHLRAILGEEPITAPPEVDRDPDYLLSQVETASILGDRQKAAEIVRLLLKENHRPPEALIHLATSLMDRAIKSEGDHGEDLSEAERLLSEVVDALRDDDPRAHRALSIRAGVRMLANRPFDSDADLARLRGLGVDDPDLINNLAVRRLHANDPAGALAELRHPVVEKVPALLLLRAQANLLAGNREAARRDFDSATLHIDDTTPPEILGAQAEAALNLGETVFAEQILLRLGSRADTVAVARITKGRLAFQRGDISDGTTHFRAAADLRRPDRQGVLQELGGRLRRADQFSAAADVFVEAGGLDLPEDGLREYATALQLAGRFPEAKRVISHLAQRGTLPDWAINIDLQLAISSGDVETAVTHLRTVIATRPQHRGEARIALARHLAILERDEEAYTELKEALGSPDLTPADLAQAAHILAHLGHDEAALSEALRAYRQAPGDRDINKTLIHIALASKADEPVEAESVAADTHVVLDGAESSVAYTIWAEGPINAQRFELSISDAEKMGLLGKHVGDEIVLHAGAWNEVRLTISKIETSRRHVISDALNNYETRFPDDDFIHSFKAPDGTSVGDLRPIISTIEGRRKQHENVFAAYGSRLFPLGWAATVLKISVQDVMATLSFSEDESSGIAAEWADLEGQKASLRIAQSSSKLVLTRSGLETAQRLNLLPMIKTRYELLAPHMLLAMLTQELHESEQSADHGKRALSVGDRGLELREIEAGHPILVEKARRAKECLAWCREHLKILPRPLQFLKENPEAERARNMIGEDSWDSIELAIDQDVPLWADDLGLRRIDISGQQAPGTSTISLLAALKEGGALGDSDYHKFLHTLIGQRYRVIAPTRDLLVSGVLRYADLGRRGISDILGTLSILQTVSAAADLFSEVLKVTATATVQMLPIEDLTYLGLEVLASRWPRVAAAQQLHNAAGRKLSLLPLPLRAIQRTCIEFGQGRPPTLT